MARKRNDDEPEKSADGHWLLDGARWHAPAPGDPSKCVVDGCDRILGEARRLREAEEALLLLDEVDRDTAADNAADPVSEVPEEDPTAPTRV